MSGVEGKRANPHGSSSTLSLLLRLAIETLRRLFPRHSNQKLGSEIKHPRCGFLSHVLPPMWSGQSMVIARLLEHLPPDTCVLITKPAYSESDADIKPFRHVLPPEPGEGTVLRRVCVGTPCLIARILVRGWRVARLIRDEHCDAIVSTTGDLVDIPAAVVASSLANKPLILYLFDDYSNQWSFAPKLQAWAAELESLAVQNAASIIVPNEYMDSELQRRYNRSSVLVRNPAFTIADVAAEEHSRRQIDGNKRVILYTGAIYHVNAAAFRILLSGMRLLDDPRPELHIYSAQPPSILKPLGIDGGDLHVHPHVDPETACRLQKRADVLFLGFSFDSQIPTVVRTSAPGKLGDYLASGRPILALAPDDSYLARFLRNHECGLVVSRGEPDLVAESLHKLLTDVGFVERVVANALRIARTEFSPQDSARRFRTILANAIQASSALDK